MNHTQKFSMEIYSHLKAMLNQEEDWIEAPNIELTNDNVTEFFTALLLANSVLYKEITGQDGDLIDTVHLFNRLAIQYSTKAKEDS